MVSAVRMRAVVAGILYCFCAVSVSAAWPLDLEIQEAALKKYLDAVGGEWVVGRDADRRITTLTGPAPKLKFIPPADRFGFIAGAAAALRGLTILDFDRAPLPSTPGTLRFEYPQRHQNEIVEGASIVVNFHESSGEYDVLINAFPRDVPPVGGAVRGKPDAAEIAAAALVRDLKRELVEVRLPNGERARITRQQDAEKRYGPLPGPVATAISDPRLLAYGGRLWRVHRVSVSIVVRRDGREKTIAARDYDIDAGTLDKDLDRSVVRVIRRLQFVRGRGYVFDPNPRNALNCDLPTREVPEKFPPYRKVRLDDLDGARRGRFVLQGPLARVVDRDNSNPEGVGADQAPDFSVFAKGEKFAAVMGYYHVHQLQRYFRRLGFGDYRHVPLEVDVDEGLGDEGEYHPPETTGGDPPYISFGQGDGIFIAEDGDVIAHEYAHMLTAIGGKGRFGVGAEGLAMTEGFGDYLAMSTFSRQTIRSGHDLACFAEWLAGDCLRRLDEKTHYSQWDPYGDEHENGKIWSAMLYRVFQTLRGRRKAADRLILQAHIDRAPLDDEPTMKSIAEGIVIAACRRQKKPLCEDFKDFGLELPYCAQRYSIAPD